MHRIYSGCFLCCVSAIAGWNWNSSIRSETVCVFVCTRMQTWVGMTQKHWWLISKLRRRDSGHARQFARKSSWNPAGVESVHWKPADINSGSLKLVEITKYFSTELQIKQKTERGVEPPLSRSFLGGNTHKRRLYRFCSICTVRNSRGPKV